VSGSTKTPPDTQELRAELETLKRQHRKTAEEAATHLAMLREHKELLKETRTVLGEIASSVSTIAVAVAGLWCNTNKGTPPCALVSAQPARLRRLKSSR
jgi:hypothetical protein